MVHVEEIKKEAKKVLEEGRVKYLIGYKRNTGGLLAAPAFIDNPGDVDQLIWEATCVHNLSRFLVDEKKKKAAEKEPDNRPVAIIAKGCDTRAINVLLQEKYIKREDVFIIGVSCENSGVVDEKKINKKFESKRPENVKFGPENYFSIDSKAGGIKVPAEEVLAERCLECKANFPVIYDVLIGEKIQGKCDNPYRSLEQIEALPSDSRWKFWQEQMDKCIRCYACRSVCPMCYCEECVVDSIKLAVTPQTTAEEKAQKIKWIEKSPVLSESVYYHMIRALHLAGRCIDCGECERVCPVNIPIRHLNKKMEKESREQFEYDAGFDPDKPSLVSCFKDDDPQDFIM
jgi:ferredoxin